MRYNRESEELYDEPSKARVIKSSRLRWAGHVVRMNGNELHKKIFWTNPGGQRGRDRPKSRWINPYPTAFPYGNGMVLHFYQQQESSTTKTVHIVFNKGLKMYV